MRSAIVQLTEGNINNNHLYLSTIMSLFPADSIGGSNENEMASKTLIVNNGIGEVISTDIAGDKKIFRKRAWVKEFFEAHKLNAGDKIVIEKISSYKFHIYPSRS